MVIEVYWLFQILAQQSALDMEGAAGGGSTVTGTYTAEDCYGIMPIIKLIRKGIFPIIQIGIPIILIIMGSIDLGKAVISSDDKEIKAAQGRLIKRVISAVVIFLLVTIVNIVFNLFSTAGIAGEGQNEVSGTNDWWTCWNEAGN